MPIYRSKYDPYDVDRKQPFHTIDVGGVRVRIWRNETYRGNVWRFDVVSVTSKQNSDEIARGIPFEESRNAVECLQRFVTWQLTERQQPNRQLRRSEGDSAMVQTPNPKRR